MNSKDIIDILQRCKDEGVLIPQQVFDEMKNFIVEKAGELEDNELIPFPLELTNVELVRVPCTYFFCLGYLIAHQGEVTITNDERLASPEEEVANLLSDIRAKSKEWGSK